MPKLLLAGLILFVALPTIAAEKSGGLTDEEFAVLMAERGARVPVGMILTDEQFKEYARKVKLEVELERFQLFNNCAPMHLIVVEDLPESEWEVPANEKHLHELALGRLQIARLYGGPDSDSLLEIRVGVLLIPNQGRVFNIGLRYYKEMSDPATGITMPAPAWIDGGLGAQNTDDDFVIAKLSKHLDDFLTEYVRVNKEACEGR